LRGNFEAGKEKGKGRKGRKEGERKKHSGTGNKFLITVFV